MLGVRGVRGIAVNRWPAGALTREEVSALLQEPTHWRVEWCEGARREPSEGYGVILPDGVLEGVPSRAKRRKLERGIHDRRTWFSAVVAGEGAGRLLVLREG